MLNLTESPSCIPCIALWAWLTKIGLELTRKYGVAGKRKEVRFKH